jgi:hypothetical protein
VSGHEEVGTRGAAAETFYEIRCKTGKGVEASYGFSGELSIAVGRFSAFGINGVMTVKYFVVGENPAFCSRRDIADFSENFLNVVVVNGFSREKGGQVIYIDVHVVLLVIC